MEIIFWRESQDLVIDRKWEDPERGVGFLCETRNDNWDRVGHMIMTTVHTEVEMPLRHLWENAK